MGIIHVDRGLGGLVTEKRYLVGLKIGIRASLECLEFFKLSCGTGLITKQKTYAIHHL